MSCIDCGIEIDSRSMRCKPCNGKNRIGPLRTCPDCGGTKHPQAKRCRACYRPYSNMAKYGEKHTKESKQKMSESALRRFDKVGRVADHNRKYYDYKIWQDGVLERDDYTCQHCDKKENLRTHHMEDYDNNPELRTELGNGITLCEYCHRNFHHLFGFKSTRAQLFWFLKNVKSGKR